MAGPGQRGHDVEAAQRKQVRRALWSVLRSRLLLVLGSSFVIVVLLGSLGYSFVHAQVYDDVCRPLSEIDLSLREMADINRRAQAYQLDPSRDAHLTLSSDEASFMLAQMVDFDVLATVGQGRMALRASVPQPGGCVAIDTVGDLEISRRRVVFVPSSLRLGDLDVSGLGIPVGALTYQPEDLASRHPRLAEHLANIESLVVEDNEVHVRLVDRYKLF